MMVEVNLKEIIDGQAEPKHIDHLGLVAGMCKDLGLVEYIDNYLPQCGTDKKLSYGQIVLGMVLNGLGYVSQPLYLYPEFMQNKALDKLIGTNC
jgi:transposase